MHAPTGGLSVVIVVVGLVGLVGFVGLVGLVGRLVGLVHLGLRVVVFCVVGGLLLSRGAPYKRRIAEICVKTGKSVYSF